MACVCTIGTIDKFCGGVNAPGMSRVLSWTCEDELLAIPAVGSGTHTVATDITYRAAVTGPPAVAAGKFYKFNISKEDMSWSSERDDNGMYKTEVKFFVSKMEAEKSYILNGATGDNLVWICPDSNGSKRIVGALGNGASLKYKAQTNPKNGYEVTVMWESAYEPYFYTGTITY